MRRGLAALGIATGVCALLATGAFGVQPRSVSIRMYAGPAVDRPEGITAGPDGALWFTDENGAIGRISPTGALSTYADPRVVGPAAITPGPDGALWFLTGNGAIGRITVAGVITTFPATNADSP